MDLTMSERIMYNVLHLTLLNSSGETVGTATGFLFDFCRNDRQSIPCLVTNRHVLSYCSRVRITFTKKTAANTPDTRNLLHAEMETAHSMYHPNPAIDLAILPIGTLLNELQQCGQMVFYTACSVEDIPPQAEWSQYSAVETVIMAGFPRGLRDEINNQPIFRSGITATHPALDFQGRPEFLIDMPCFKGCSGSPVMICDEGWYVNKRINSISSGGNFALLGIQCAIPRQFDIGYLETIPTFDAEQVPVVPLHMNLGYIIKSTELLVFDDILRAKYNI